jgi:hypothetical protein
MALDNVEKLLGGCWSVTAKAISLLALILIVVILLPSLFQTRLVLRALSVPQAFQESGFTSEVATAALGTAIAQIKLEPKFTRKHTDVQEFNRANSGSPIHWT